MPFGGAFSDAAAAVFIHKGTNGRWKDLRTADDDAACEARALAELGPECAAWLAGRGQSTGVARAPRHAQSQGPVESKRRP